MTLTIYGIPNCDTVKRARAWLAGHGLPFVFHDFKKDGLTGVIVAGWLQRLPWDVLVNRKGTTWRGLPQARKDAILDAGSALALMLQFPSVIKRPVLVLEVPAPAQGQGQVQVGFSDSQYRQLFNLPPQPTP
jgi:arsenate reductase (glutaredoxin)